MSNMYVPGTDAPKSITVEGAAAPSTLGPEKRDYRAAKLFSSNIDLLNVAQEIVQPDRATYSSNSVNFMLSASEAGELMAGLIQRHNLGGEKDYIKMAFVEALIDCYALNSSSLQMPGRAWFELHVQGAEPRRFDFFLDVIQILGDDARRFFRAYADYTRDRLKKLHKSVQAGAKDEKPISIAKWDAEAETWDHVLRVAAERGLTRYPYLIHDSADACTRMTAPERVAVMQSKNFVTAMASASGHLIDGSPGDNRGSLAPTKARAPIAPVSQGGPSKYNDY